MNKRERKWLKAKQDKRRRQWFYKETRNRTFRTFFECNMMGSRVFLNEAGKVEVKILTTDELIDLKMRLDSGEVLPQ